MVGSRAGTTERVVGTGCGVHTRGQLGGSQAAHGQEGEDEGDGDHDGEGAGSDYFNVSLTTVVVTCGLSPITSRQPPDRQQQTTNKFWVTLLWILQTSLIVRKNVSFTLRLEAKYSQINHLTD